MTSNYQPDFDKAPTESSALREQAAVVLNYMTVMASIMTPSETKSSIFIGEFTEIK